MESSDSFETPWSESDSLNFIEVGRIHIPDRDQIQETILDLIPAQEDEQFLVVDLGIGAGWLSRAILDRFPGARVLGLDPSPAMLGETEGRLREYTGRFDLRRFRLQDRSWLADVGRDVRCFVSSLVIHHLDPAGKKVLYQDLHEHLGDPSAVLIADLVAPTSDLERRYMADRWEAEVRRQSLAFTGALDVYQQFLESHSNWYRYPDPVDMPSSVPEHLAWLSEAGFVSPNVFWERAGHAIYGGFKGSQI